MDETNPLVALLNGIVYDKLTAIPFILQFVKMGIGLLPALKDKAGAIMGAVASGAATWFAVTGGMEAKLDLWTIVAQVGLSVAYVHGAYLLLVRPLARSNNPVIPANPAILLVVAAAVMLLAPAADAQTKYSIWDVGKRTQLSVNLGGLFFFEEETGAESSKGISAAGALTYSLHDRFSIAGLYDHVFPIDASGRHEDILGGAANLRVYPLPGETSQTKLFLGANAVMFSPGADDQWSGYGGHLTIARVFRDGWSLSAKYQHVIPFEDGRRKVDMAKLALNHRLAGAK